MLEDLVTYREKIEKRDIKINELKEELKQLEKNIEANNRIFMRNNQKNSKPTKKNIFLFHSNRKGKININKKQDIIIHKNNLKTSSRKKAKSTPKIGENFSINKNNYIINSEKKKFNFNFYTNRGRTFDFKNNKTNLNNINNNMDVNKRLFQEKLVTNTNNNMKQIRLISESFNKKEKKKNEHNNTEINSINNISSNYFENLNEKKKQNIFVNKIITNNTSCHNNYNGKININKDIPTKIKVEHFVKKEKNNIKNENVDMYKNIENYIDSVFNKYFLYYKNNMNVSYKKDNKK